MSKLSLAGMEGLTLSIESGCIALEMNRRGNQKRIIPITHVLCVEVAEPKEDHRGYIYFRTPVANKTIKASIARDYIIDDDIVFFNDSESYKTALAIQEYIANYAGRI